MNIRAHRGYIFPIAWPVCSHHILYTEICNFAILGPLRPLAWGCGSELHFGSLALLRLSPAWFSWLCFASDQWKSQWLHSLIKVLPVSSWKLMSREVQWKKLQRTYPKLLWGLVDCSPYLSRCAMLLWSMIIPSMAQGEASCPTTIANRKCRQSLHLGRSNRMLDQTASYVRG